MAKSDAFTASSGEPAPPTLGVGDVVVAHEDIRGFFRRRVRRGTRGIVAGRTPADELEVHFDGHDVELVAPKRLRRAVDAVVDHHHRHHRH
jgi:hypothetical protein